MLLDGTRVAEAIRAEVAPRVAAFQKLRARPPALHIVLVGGDPASRIYVSNKERAGTAAGLAVIVHRLPDSATLDKGVKELASKYPKQNVARYFWALLWQDPETWGGLKGRPELSLE